MNDKEIYKRLGKIIYNEANSIETHINLVVHKSKSGLVQIISWTGEVRDNLSAFVMSPQSNQDVLDLTCALYDFYTSNGMGDWNVYHLIVDPINSNFDIQFENSEELASGRLKFWKYCRKFSKN